MDRPVDYLMVGVSSLISLCFLVSGLISFVLWLKSSSPRQSFIKWVADIKTYDSMWKVMFMILSIALLVLPYLFVRMIYGMFYELVASILCYPFNFEFSHYLQGEERARYTTWWRDCTEGGWLLFVGPFGITRIVRSRCR